MKLSRCLILIFFCIFLQSCASSKISQQVQQGKNCFNAAEYKQSFRKLMPAAVNGDPQAEYAVGYMYYYGLGVSQDEESGIFWMNKAADQGYPPAIRALNLIHCTKNKDTCPYHAEPDKARRHVYSKDSVLRSVAEPPPATVKIYADKAAEKKYSDADVYRVAKKSSGQMTKQSNSPMTAANKPAHVVSKPKSEEASAKPSFRPYSENKKYSLQMLGSYHLADVKKAQKALGPEAATHIWHTKHNGKDWYVLTYGQYASLMQANLAMDEMPQEVRDFKPWVRDVGVIDAVG